MIDPHSRSRYIWSDKPNKQYVEFLSCSEDIDFWNMLYKFLELQNLETSTQNATKEDIYSCIKIFHSVVANYAKNDYTLNVMLYSFTYIKPM